MSMGAVRRIQPIARAGGALASPVELRRQSGAVADACVPIESLVDRLATTPVAPTGCMHHPAKDSAPGSTSWMT